MLLLDDKMKTSRNDVDYMKHGPRKLLPVNRDNAAEIWRKNTQLSEATVSGAVCRELTSPLKCMC